MDHRSVARSGHRHRHRRPVLAQQPIDALRPTSVGHKTVCKKKAPGGPAYVPPVTELLPPSPHTPAHTLFGRHTWPGSSCFSQVFAKSAGPLA
jgi:hypothetical protein